LNSLLFPIDVFLFSPTSFVIFAYRCDAFGSWGKNLIWIGRFNVIFSKFFMLQGFLFFPWDGPWVITFYPPQIPKKKERPYSPSLL
jgi:hypothetical protein